MGVILENNFFPCIPIILKKAIRSEQDRIEDLLGIGISLLPGFVLKIFSVYLSSEYSKELKYDNGLAPENASLEALIQQSPQNS